MKEELLVDTYYMYDFTSGDSRTGPAGRIFDTQSNSFTMNYLKLGLEVDADPVTVRADVGYGALAAVLGGSGGVVVEQAYASLKIPGTPLTVDMGRFVTTAGAEVIEANKNWLYSRSFIFGVIPFYHTGLRLNLKVNDMIGVQATVANSAVVTDPDNNANKVIGLSATVAPLSTTTIIGTAYFGKEGPPGAQGPEKITLDLVANHNVSDALALNLNFDYVKLDTAHTAGAALMGHYVANEHVLVNARVEFLADKGIFIGGTPPVSHNLFEGTVGLGLPFAGHLEIRPELRGDFSGDALFPGTTPKKNQFTGTLAFLGFI